MAQKDEFITDLYLRLYDFLLDYALPYMENFSQAEEAVQETFRIACQRRDALRASNRPEGWIVNTLKNVISNMRKNRNAANRTFMKYLATQSLEENATEELIRLELLYEDLAQTEEWKLLKEMAVDGDSYLEMAQRRGIKVDACRKRVQRARETLQKKISESCHK